jgi:SAM-dependent methyltransferase
MTLLNDDELGRSAVAANCRMNRERNLSGSNGYDRELGFNPLDVLKERIAAGRSSTWLDLCCGTGKALIEAARIVHDQGLARQIEIVGVDLVGMFHEFDPGLTCLRLVEASLSSWCPDCHFDLITCVHGLHYVGDKLRLLARAATWMVEDGVFVANLDLANVKLSDGGAAGRALIADLQGAGLQYDRRKRRVVCRGYKAVDLPYPLPRC